MRLPALAIAAARHRTGLASCSRTARPFDFHPLGLLRWEPAAHRCRACLANTFSLLLSFPIRVGCLLGFLSV